MLIKQFRARQVRVPDPMRPGRFAMEERLAGAGATAISHEGKSYEANEDGWFDVPHEVGLELLKGHYPGGERFHTDAEVGEHVRFGAADAGELPSEKKKADRKGTKSDSE